MERVLLEELERMLWSAGGLAHVLAKKIVWDSLLKNKIIEAHIVILLLASYCYYSTWLCVFSEKYRKVDNFCLINYPVSDFPQGNY